MESTDRNVTNENYVLTEEGKKLKICCACPETREVRDECIIRNGQENCVKAISDHIACLKKLGFNM